jgi:hypothetical protein
VVPPVAAALAEEVAAVARRFSRRIIPNNSHRGAPPTVNSTAGQEAADSAVQPVQPVAPVEALAALATLAAATTAAVALVEALGLGISTLVNITSTRVHRGTAKVKEAESMGANSVKVSNCRHRRLPGRLWKSPRTAPAEDRRHLPRNPAVAPFPATWDTVAPRMDLLGTVKVGVPGVGAALIHRRR